MEYMIRGRNDGAGEWGPAAAQANHFAANIVFLISEEGVKGEGGGEYVSSRVKEQVEPVEANEHLDVC